jgi:hypothetical protein
MNSSSQSEADIMNSGRINFEGFDFDLFRTTMIENEGQANRPSLSGEKLFHQYLEDIHGCLHRSLGYPDYKWIVSKEGNHGVKHSKAIDFTFPGTRYLVVVRDPRDVYASFKQIASKKRLGVNTPTFKDLITPARFILDNGGKNFTAFEECFDAQRIDNRLYLFLRYEDIVRDPKSELTKVAEFLDIPFQPSLVQPTNLTNVWGGNSSSLKSFSGLTNSRTEKWKTELTLSERRVIEYFLSQYLVDGKYGVLSDPVSRTTIFGDLVASEWSEGFAYDPSTTRWLRSILKGFGYVIRMLKLCLQK